ncbi:hypothetical protein U1Q18_044480, partial [Sarracenia purpurea var. burkii]
MEPFFFWARDSKSSAEALETTGEEDVHNEEDEVKESTKSMSYLGGDGAESETEPRSISDKSTSGSEVDEEEDEEGKSEKEVSDSGTDIESVSGGPGGDITSHLDKKHIVEAQTKGTIAPKTWANIVAPKLNSGAPRLNQRSSS